MDSSKILHICLLLFSLQEITGVQFKHFPIANGRSESNGPRKFQPRLPAPPTGRPASSSDINPFHLSHLQDEEELRNDKEPITRDHRPVSRNRRPQSTEARPTPFVIGTTGSTNAIRNQRPNTIDRRPTTIEGFNSRGQLITQGPSDQRPDRVATKHSRSRGFLKSQATRQNRPTAIEGFDNRGRPVALAGTSRTGLSRRPSENQRATVQTVSVPSQQRRLKESNKQLSQQISAGEEKVFQNRGRLHLKNKNRQPNTPKRQRGNVATNLSKRNRKFAEQRRFNVQQRTQETDYIIETANFNRARARPVNVKNRKDSETGQKRRKQSRLSQQSHREVEIPKNLESFQAVPVETPRKPIQRFKVSEPAENNEIVVTEERKSHREVQVPKNLESFQAVPVETPQKPIQRFRVSEPAENIKVVATEERKNERAPPKNIVRFPNFDPSNKRIKQHNVADVKHKIELKEKEEIPTPINLRPTSEDIEDTKDESLNIIPTTSLPKSEEIILPPTEEIESDPKQVKLVPGVVWLNGKKVWETNFLVRDQEEEPRSVEIELDNSKLTGINIGVAMDKMKTTWEQDPHREQIRRPNKPKNVVVEIGKPKIDDKRREKNPSTQTVKSQIISLDDRNQVPSETTIRPKETQREPENPKKQQTANIEPVIQSSQIEYTNEVQVEQTKQQNPPQNVNLKAKLPLQKPIIKSTIIRQTPISFKARQPTVSIPEIEIHPTQRPFRIPPKPTHFEDSSTQAPIRQQQTPVPIRNRQTEVPFQRPSTAPLLRSQPKQPNFPSQPLRFRNPSTQTLFKNPPTQSPFQNKPKLPIPANRGRNEIVRSSVQFPETNQPDALSFVPLSFSNEYDDTDTISIDWGR